MKRNPERIAWIILSTAFAIFCLLSIVIPLAVRWYIINATDPLTTEVTSVRGTVLIGDPAAELSLSVTDGNSTSLEETFEVATDDTSQAILAFFDDSTLTMYSNTSIHLQKAQIPSFSISSQPTRIVIEVQQGRIRVTSSRSRDDLSVDIQTPHTLVELNQGSFSIEVDEQETQVTTRLGQAEVISNGYQVTLEQEQRAVVGLNSPPSPPLPAAQNLLGHSHFSPTFDKTWETYAIDPIEGVTTTVKVTNFQGQSVLQLSSQGQDNVHTETGVIQQVNKDVRDFQSLRLFAEVRLIQQTLPGGGQLGSEFPIMLHIAYRDAEGNDRDWFHGFYYAPPPENYILYNQPDNSSERIARFIWYPYESVNLLATLGPTKPVFIKSVRIYASGWIYNAMVDNIFLLGQE